MKVSLNVVKRLIDFELPPTDKLVESINQQLGGVEEVIDLADKYKDVLIVKVVECVKHPDSDHLSVTKIDDGGVCQTVERDENGLIQVVCGAPNVRADMFAAWLPPASIVPSSYDDAEPFVLSARKLRGVLSQGMMAASDELGFDSNHETIIEIDPNEKRLSDEEIKPGASFAKCFGLDDTVIDIENKMFTHRPDLFGQIGVAREIAGILGYEFHDLDWYWSRAVFDSAKGLELNVFNEALDKSPRFMSVALQNISVAPSPLWLQCALVAMGSKPISNVVDITNYLMLMTAQPVHAYDYDQLKDHKLGVRMAKKGEIAKLLNGKTYELDENDIVIADGDGVVGLAGIMGGGPSEVTAGTKNVALEVATFDMYAVRKTSMKYGLFTEALTRFNKGQSPLQNERVIAQLMAMLGELAGASQASDVFDLRDHSLQPAIDRQSLYETQPIGSDFINQRLGLDLASADIQKLLHNVKFACYDEDGKISFTAPFWRTDIELPEDIVEEVGRLYGFDKLPRELPTRSMKPAPENPSRALKRKLRLELARFGANEVLSYSFVHEKTLEKAGQNPEMAFHLSNALSPEIQLYRLSLTPSLLDVIHSNIRAGYDQLTIFEFGKAHHKQEFNDDLPSEFSRLAFVYASRKKTDQTSYFTAKRYFEMIVRAALGDVDLHYRPLSELEGGSDLLLQQAAPFDETRSAVVYFGDNLLGVVGEYRSSVGTGFKLPQASAGFELDFDLIVSLANGSAQSYRAISRYPSVSQDLSLKTSSEVSYQDLTTLIQKSLDEKTSSQNLIATLSPLAIYKADSSTIARTITYHIEIFSYERTLKERDASKIIEYLVFRANQKYQAERA